jgi:DNA replication protein DnaC
MLAPARPNLAVGVMRVFAGPVIFKQNTLLRALRTTYKDPDAPDPILTCQNADLLALDEVGVSSGGRDEYPMIHEIIDRRIGEFAPTVITSNSTIEQLRETLGPRLVDRVRQAAFKVLNFGGESHRADLRSQYLATATPEPQKPKPTLADFL